ncbi:MAG TPA: hypothetical protein VGO11_13765 [Chthoniobacteraceae bacterium]|jgi:hypothetical protein|nr:hypothetical protein [Chthoniobacteraceae bacterium]
MSWSLDSQRKVWKCTEYTDLDYAEINNLAEYGQPNSPYEKGFDPDFDPDFSKVTVEMPQIEVMTNGYGRNVSADTFEVVRRFLRESLPFPTGTYNFYELVQAGFANLEDRLYITNLYGRDAIRLSGKIDLLGSAYIHGSVSFALMRSTRFLYAKTYRRVVAEIGARDDNWDFESSNWFAQKINRILPPLVGPDHYNLDPGKPIRLNYTGPGKISIAESSAPNFASALFYRYADRIF